MQRSLLLWAVFYAILLVAPSAAADEVTCGRLEKPPGGFGPLDYRTASSADIGMVESFHFTPEVESLRSGRTGSLGSDIEFILLAFPNHYRALNAMMNLQFKLKTDRPPGAHWPVACYFERAIRFQPDDATVRIVFGVYLLRLGKAQDAITQFEKAAELGDDSGNLHYNAGLAYFAVGDYDKAVEHAQKAYAAGFSLPGLKEKLVKAGKWPAAK